MEAIPILIIFVIVLIMATGWYLEYRDWNGGICRKSGKPWIQFDTDSQGGMMFKDGCGNHVTISYPFIIK